MVNSPPASTADPMAVLEAQFLKEKRHNYFMASSARPIANDDPTRSTNGMHADHKMEMRNAVLAGSQPTCARAVAASGKSSAGRSDVLPGPRSSSHATLAPHSLTSASDALGPAALPSRPAFVDVPYSQPKYRNATIDMHGESHPPLPPASVPATAPGGNEIMLPRPMSPSTTRLGFDPFVGSVRGSQSAKSISSGVDRIDYAGLPFNPPPVLCPTTVASSLVTAGNSSIGNGAKDALSAAKVLPDQSSSCSSAPQASSFSVAQTIGSSSQRVTCNGALAHDQQLHLQVTIKHAESTGSFAITKATLKDEKKPAPAQPVTRTILATGTAEHLGMMFERWRFPVFGEVAAVRWDKERDRAYITFAKHDSACDALGLTGGKMTPAGMKTAADAAWGSDITVISVNMAKGSARSYRKVPTMTFNSSGFAVQATKSPTPQDVSFSTARSAETEQDQLQLVLQRTIHISGAAEIINFLLPRYEFIKFGNVVDIRCEPVLGKYSHAFITFDTAEAAASASNTQRGRRTDASDTAMPTFDIDGLRFWAGLAVELFPADHNDLLQLYKKLTPVPSEIMDACITRAKGRLTNGPLTSMDSMLVANLQTELYSTKDCLAVAQRALEKAHAELWALKSVPAAMRPVPPAIKPVHPLEKTNRRAGWIPVSTMASDQSSAAEELSSFETCLSADAQQSRLGKRKADEELPCQRTPKRKSTEQTRSVDAAPMDVDPASSVAAGTLPLERASEAIRVLDSCLDRAHTNYREFKKAFPITSRQVINTRVFSALLDEIRNIEVHLASAREKLSLIQVGWDSGRGDPGGPYALEDILHELGLLNSCITFSVKLAGLFRTDCAEIHGQLMANIAYADFMLAMSDMHDALAPMQDHLRLESPSISASVIQQELVAPIAASSGQEATLASIDGNNLQRNCDDGRNNSVSITAKDDTGPAAAKNADNLKAPANETPDSATPQKDQESIPSVGTDDPILNIVSTTAVSVTDCDLVTVIPNSGCAPEIDLVGDEDLDMESVTRQPATLHCSATPQVNKSVPDADVGVHNAASASDSATHNNGAQPVIPLDGDSKVLQSLELIHSSLLDAFKIYDHFRRQSVDLHTALHSDPTYLAFLDQMDEVEPAIESARAILETEIQSQRQTSAVSCAEIGSLTRDLEGKRAALVDAQTATSSAARDMIRQCFATCASNAALFVTHHLLEEQAKERVADMLTSTARQRQIYQERDDALAAHELVKAALDKLEKQCLADRSIHKATEASLRITRSLIEDQEKRWTDDFAETREDIKQLMLEKEEAIHAACLADIALDGSREQLRHEQRACKAAEAAVEASQLSLEQRTSEFDKATLELRQLLRKKEDLMHATQMAMETERSAWHEEQIRLMQVIEEEYDARKAAEAQFDVQTRTFPPSRPPPFTLIPPTPGVDA